jgi:hypothetical protein
VYVTTQVDVVVPGVRVHGLPEKPPVAEPLEKMTVPPGADGVPESVSDTTTVQVVDWWIATGLGEQRVTCVEVERATTSPKPAPLLLPAWTESFGE